jgi:3-oxoacyl-[acyl-carrier protein] reductase
MIFNRYRPVHITLILCLPAASFLAGALIPVDGGLMACNA